MNWLDIVIIVVLIISFLGGLTRGIIGTVLPLAGLVVGIWLAGSYHGTVAGWLDGVIKNESWADVAGYAIIVVLALIASWVIASILGKFVRLIFMGWIDRLAGAALGLVLGAVLVGAALAALLKFQVFGVGNVIEDSGLAAVLLKYFPMVLELLPEEFESVREFFG